MNDRRPTTRTEAEEGTLMCPVCDQARRRPQTPAVIGKAGEALSYAALDLRIRQAAWRLRASGVQAGDRVALHGPPGLDYLAALWALWRLGAVACPLSTRAPADVLAAQVPHLRSLTVVQFGEAPPGFALPGGVQVLAGAALCKPEATPDIEASGRPAALEAERPATVVFTSGSTAQPKAAVHSLSNHYFSAEGARQNIALEPGDRWLLSLPLYHVGGLAIVFRCFWAGAAVALPPAGASLPEVLAHRRITHASMVATQLRRLLQDGPQTAPRHVQALLLGGGPLPADLIKNAYRRGWPVHTTYGLTEMASQVTTTPPGAPLEVLQTAGQLLPHRRLRLAPDGEVLVKGRTLFLGYLEDGEEGAGYDAPPRLRRPVDEAGWYRTGDRGTLDAEGRLCLTGRTDNLFISGGENVQPEEVEAALRRVPGIAEAVVVPVPDAEFGQRPVAFVRAEEEGGGVPGGVQNSLARHLPRFKLPVAFYTWPPDAPAGGMKTDRAFFHAEAQRRADKTRRRAEAR